MSDLGAIFHVKKAGVQYDAHAYTTIDECPEPNLKVNFKGTQAYIKLVTKGEGDVPCYTKTKTGSIWQVKKEALIAPPIGSIRIQSSGSFTVPQGVTVICITGEFNAVYVGVTPNTTHEIIVQVDEVRENMFRVSVRCTSHNILSASELNQVQDAYDPSYLENIRISWSPEINTYTPDVKDY